MTRTRILASAVALVGVGMLTACDPEEALQTIQHVYDAHRTPEDDPSTPGVESDPSQPPIDDVCAQCIPIVTIPPEEIPEPVQLGWTWDPVTYTVTNHDVPSLQVRAKHGPFQEPLLVPFVTLTPGQSVTIPPAPCGSPVRLIIGGEMFQPFTFC